jgi:hypothetical protein
VPGSTPFLLEVAPGSKKWQARGKINAVYRRRVGKEFRNYLFIKGIIDFRLHEKNQFLLIFQPSPHKKNIRKTKTPLWKGF